MTITLIRPITRTRGMPTRPLCLHPKDTVRTTPNSGTRLIALILLIRQLLMPASFALKMLSIVPFLQLFQILLQTIRRILPCILDCRYPHPEEPQAPDYHGPRQTSSHNHKSIYVLVRHHLLGKLYITMPNNGAMHKIRYLTIHVKSISYKSFYFGIKIA